MYEQRLIELAVELSDSGLIWNPEIGDEVTEREEPKTVSILVDPQGRSPNELRTAYLWLPTLEQLVMQFEARQAIIFHAGINDKFKYETVIKTQLGVIEAIEESLRLTFCVALRKLLDENAGQSFH